MRNSSPSDGKGRRPNRHLTLFMSIAVTFLVLCALLSISSVISLESSTRSFRKELTRVGVSEAEAAAVRVQSQLNEYLQLCDLIAADTNLHRLPERMQEGQAAWNSAAMSVRATLLSAQANFGDVYIQTVAVYYPEDSAIISSTMTYSDVLIDYFISQYSLPDGFLQNLPVARHGIVFPGGDSCWIARGAFKNGKIFAYILLNFHFENVFAEHYEKTDMLCIRSAGTSVYLSSGDEAVAGALDALPTAGLEARPVPLGDGDYYAQTKSIKNLGIDIISMKDAGESLREIRHFRTRGLVQIAASLLIMLGLGFVFTYRIYLPIKRLLTNAMIATPVPTVSHAMDSVGTTLQKLSDEKQQFQNTVNDAEYLIQGERLHQVMNLPEPALAEAFRQFMRNIQFEPDMPITVTPLSYDAKVLANLPISLAEPQGQSQGRFFSMAYTLLDSYLNEKFRFTLLRYAGFFVLITNYQEEGDLPLIRQALGGLDAFFRSDALSGVVYTAPQIIHTALDMRDCLGRAPSEMENLLFYSSSRQADTPDAAPRRPIPSLQRFNSLTRLLETGSYHEAYDCMEQIVDDLFAQSTDYRHCIYRIHGLLIMVLTALQKNNPDISGINLSAYEARLGRADNISALRREIRAITEEIIVFSDADSSGSSVTMAELQAYLEENYMNHELSLSLLSAIFSLSESTISRIFRQERNMTFLEYIQSLRVHKAKQLLVTESVKDTAKLVGFWDTQALIRVFKKYEGITPGQYKDLLQKE